MNRAVIFVSHRGRIAKLLPIIGATTNIAVHRLQQVEGSGAAVIKSKLGMNLVNTKLINVDSVFFT